MMSAMKTITEELAAVAEPKELRAPGVSVILYIIGGISLAVGAFMLADALADSRNAATEAQMGPMAIVSALFFFALGYVCHKLRQIAAHLAAIRNR
jgi:hypothetical protein